MCAADFVRSVTCRGGFNKVHYQTFTQSMNVLKRCRTDHSCHYLHQATLRYNIEHYGGCLNLIRQSKITISVPGSIYMPVVLSRLDDRPIRKLGDYKCPVDTIMEKVLIDIFTKTTSLSCLYPRLSQQRYWRKIAKMNGGKLMSLITICQNCYCAST